VILIGETTLGEFQGQSLDNMRDTCVVLHHDSTARDAHNKPKPTWVPQEPSPCRFRLTPGREVQNGSETALADGVLKLPLGTIIASLDRVEITHRKGRPIPPLQCEVIGVPVTNSLEIIVNLRLVRGA
jgi:hypothetical protein